MLAAEERLRAARANIGAARAAFFPRISLTGAAGFASSALGSLFGGDGLTWSFGPSISLPIFDGGRNRGNLTVAQAREDIAVASYEVTVQGAFREVADALAGRQYYAEQVAAGTRGLTAARQIARLARLRYREGVAAYIEVLDAERNLFFAEQLLIQLRRAQADNLVDALRRAGRRRLGLTRLRWRRDGRNGAPQTTNVGTQVFAKFRCGAIAALPPRCGVPRGQEDVAHESR